MAIVQEYKFGNTKVLIDDTYCKENTPENYEELQKRVAAIVFKYLPNKIPIKQRG